MNKSELQTVACAVAAGDHAAFRTFYDHYYLRIYRFVYALLRNVCDTEAVVSNVFCLIWEKRRLLTHVQAMDAYLFQISRNESYHYLKKRNSAQCISIEELFVEAAPSNESVIDTLTEQEMMRAYRKAVERLPSNVALGAWVSGDYAPLSEWLFRLLPHAPKAFTFDRHHPLVAMRTLTTEAGTLLICINKSAAGETIALNRPVKTKEMIYATLGAAGMDGSKIVLPSEGILVARIR